MVLLERPASVDTDWYRVSATEACDALAVDVERGPDGRGGRPSARRSTGRTRSPKKPRSRRGDAFLRQYRDLMQLVLVGAAVVSIVAPPGRSHRPRHPRLTVFNAVMGLHQEGKAAESVAALQQMLIMTAQRRVATAQIVEIPAEELVPGDIVGFEAGDKVPADGRMLVAATPRDRGGGAHRREHAGAKVIEPVTGDGRAAR